MLRFSEEDVIKLAKGVVEDPIGYCYDKKKMVQIIITVSSVSQQAAKKGRLQHDLDCIVLIAQDILTGVDK